MEYISRGRRVLCQQGAFSEVGAIVASFVFTECPVGSDMWGIFGKPLRRAFLLVAWCLMRSVGAECRSDLSLCSTGEMGSCDHDGDSVK